MFLSVFIQHQAGHRRAPVVSPYVDVPLGTQFETSAGFHLESVA
jgi:hypothetical protein